MQKLINKFKECDKHFDSIEFNLNFLIKKAIEHGERLKRIEENMATKSDMAEIIKKLDNIVQMLEKREMKATLLRVS